MKDGIKIPLMNWWYIILTLVFILAKNSGIIDWSPLWILSPLWIPSAIALIIWIIIMFLRILLEIISFINSLYRKYLLKHKIK